MESGLRSDVDRLVGAAAHVQPGHVDGASGWAAETGVGALKLGSVAGGEEAAATGDGQQQVLGTEEGVVFAHALPLRLHVLAVGRAVDCHLLPGHGEVALYAVLSLQFQVGVSDLLQQRMAVPGGAVEDGCDVGGGAHGAKLLVVFFRFDVLGFVHLQQDVGRVAHHVGVGLGAEEDLPALAEDHGVSRIHAPVATVAGVVQPFLEAVHADEALGQEGGRCLDHVAAVILAHGEVKGGELGGKLVLSTLAGNLHGEGEALAVGARFSL